MKKVGYSFIFAVVVFGLENFINYSILPSQAEMLIELALYHAFVVFWIAFIAYSLGERSKEKD